VARSRWSGPARAAWIDAATLRNWLRRGERSTREGRFGRFLADVRAAEAGQRVGLEPDRGKVVWAMRVLEREWSGPDPDSPPPGGPTVIELHLAEEND
jgi:hypothetical protein